MISAFSNNPNFSYQNCVNNGDSIVLASHEKNGKRVFENDFITGSVTTPFHVQDEYDQIMGEGEYFKLCEKSDELFDKFVNRRAITKIDIKELVEKMTEFTAKKCSKKLNSGIYTKEEARGIFNEFARKRDMIYRKYNIRENSEVISGTLQSASQTQCRVNSQMTPNDLSNLSVSTTINSPGTLSEMLSKVRTRIVGIFSNEKPNER